MIQRHSLPQPANPGASATAVVYDDLANLNTYESLTSIPSAATNIGSRYQRATVVCYLSHAATFKHEWAARGSTNLRVVNGNGAGEAIPATTLFERSCFLLPGRNKLTINTGTACTTWEVEAHLNDSAPLVQ